MNQQVNLGLWHRLSQLVIGLIVLACLLGVFFWYLPVFQQNTRMRQHLLVLESQIKAEEQQKAELETAIKNLRDDPKTLERMAREKLGYGRPGETVIYFETPQPNR